MKSNFILVAPCWSKNVFDVHLYCDLVGCDIMSGYEEPLASVSTSTMKMEAVASYGTLVPTY